MEAEQLKTFMDISGADEAEARHALEAFGWDLNAAVNHFLEHGAADVFQRPPEAVPDVTREADLRQVGNDVVHNSSGSRSTAIPAASPEPFWRRNDDVFEGARAGPSPVRVEPVVDSYLGGFGDQVGTRMEPSPRVSHPPDVLQVPILWKDGNDPAEPNAGRFGLLAPRIEELPADAEVEGTGASARAYYEEGEEDDALSSRNAFNNGASTQVVSPPLTEPEEDRAVSGARAREYADYGVGSALGAGDDEEMLRVAIEKSKQEAEDSEARRFQNSLAADDADRMDDGEEDPDVARAMALSIETANLERARREEALVSDTNRGGADMDIDFSDDKENKGDLGSAVAKIDERPHQLAASINLEDEEEEEVEEAEPLVRRRTHGRRASPIGRSIWPTAEQFDDAPQAQPYSGERVVSHARNGSWAGMEDVGHQSYLPDDELAGVSAEEQEEAKMIEAAMFGVPYVPRNGGAVAGPANYPIPPGLAAHLGSIAGRFPVSPRHVGYGVYEDSDDGEEEGFLRRQAPEPPSEAVIEQRLLREQQDDEYMASLVADREKEERAELEKEAARRAAEAEEERQREEADLAQKAAEELELKLKAKQEALPTEPSADDSEAITLQVRMPDGSRRSRRFRKTDHLQALFDFVDVVGGVTPGSYRLVRTYPRRTFAERSGEEAQSFEELGLSSSRQETLLLENI